MNGDYGGGIPFPNILPLIIIRIIIYIIKIIKTHFDGISEGGDFFVRKMMGFILDFWVSYRSFNWKISRREFKKQDQSFRLRLYSKLVGEIYLLIFSLFHSLVYSFTSSKGIWGISWKY